jgi:hypothetical protein
MAQLVRSEQLDPTDALVKVASQSKLTPPQVRRVGEAYNVSRSLANHKMASGEARCDAFPIAFPDKALVDLFPGQYKTAGELYLHTQLNKAAGLTTVEGGTVPNFIEKLAHAEQQSPYQQNDTPLPVVDLTVYQADPNHAYARFEKKANDHRLQLQAKQQQLAEAKLNFQSGLTKAALAVRQHLNTVPFARLEKAAAARYGADTGVKLASLLYATSKAGELGHARATGPFRNHTLEDFEQSPLNEVDSFVKAAMAVHTLSTELSCLKEAAPENPFSGKPHGGNPLIKSAGPWMSRINQAAFGGLGTSTGPAEQQELGKAMNQVEDPDTRDLIRKQKVQAMLTEMLTTDPVLSKHDPEEVLDHYNELSQLAPEMADQPMMLRGILRRSIEAGGVDPFEAGQYIGNAKGIKDLGKSDRSNLESMAVTPQNLDPSLAIRDKGQAPSNRSQIANILGLPHTPGQSITGNATTSDPAMQLQQQQFDLQHQNQQQQQVHQQRQQKLDVQKFNTQNTWDATKRNTPPIYLGDPITRRDSPVVANPLEAPTIPLPGM